MKPKAKYRELDDRVINLLKHGPCTPYRIGLYMEVNIGVAKIVLRRLKSEGLITWQQDDTGAKLKVTAAVKKCPMLAVFPAPPYKTDSVGFFG